MKERPILFSGPMVRALLAGTKTQTRRICKPQPHVERLFAKDGMVLKSKKNGTTISIHCPLIALACPYGEIGDRLWVRETWAFHVQAIGAVVDSDGPFVYRADSESTQHRLCEKWRPSIHMNRWASRILLEIVSVRVERLSDISEADSVAEGIGNIRVSETDSRWLNYIDPESKGAAFGDPRHSFWSLWESINGRASRDANPWVWVVEFKRVEGGAA